METFNNVINSGQLVLVDFFATWCQPCKAMHPILEQVKSVLGDRIRIIKVDVDKNRIKEENEHKYITYSADTDCADGVFAHELITK